MFKGKITVSDFISDYCIDDVSVRLATYGASCHDFVSMTGTILSSEIEPMYLEWKVSKFYFYADGFLYLLIAP